MYGATSCVGFPRLSMQYPINEENITSASFIPVDLAIEGLCEDYDRHQGQHTDAEKPFNEESIASTSLVPVDLAIEGLYKDRDRRRGKHANNEKPGLSQMQLVCKVAATKSQSNESS